MTAERMVLRAIAMIGNAAALFVLLLILLNGRVLFFDRPAESRAAERPARRLLFILIDGLREDAAADASIMPELQALAARGSRGVARVEALIPSTIAGVRAEVEGVVSAPASFVFDFASRAAPHGGFFEEVRRAGGRSFVAGPRIWTDLYRRWIDEAVTGLDDARLLEAALLKAADPKWHLVVVHFSQVDRAAHLWGGKSAQYRTAAAWCDAAAGQFARAAGTESAILVTADHGVTNQGGHAGPEPDVLRIPVVARGAPRVPPELRQVEIAGVVGGVGWTEGTGWTVWTFGILGGALALVAAVRLVGGVQQEKRTAAFWLHLGFWVVAALGFLSLWGAAAAGVAWLAMVGKGAPRGLERQVVLAVGGGVLAGGWRLFSTAGGMASGTLAQSGLALLLGAAGAKWVVQKKAGVSTWRALGFGAGAVVVADLFLHAPGESVSLSSLDVRLAFLLAETWAGLPGAICAAAFQPFLPLICLLLASVPFIGKTEPFLLAMIAAGAGAALMGEALAGAMVLSRVESGGLPSLALALLIRSAGAILLVFPVFAGGVALWARLAKWRR